MTSDYDKLIRDLERASWERRLWKAIRDGLDLVGPEAVHDAIDAVAELAVDRRAGRRREPIPYGMVKATERWLNAVAAGRKPPSLGQLAITANISKTAVKDWMEGDRWSELLGLALAERMAERDEQRREQRRQEYDALFDAITQPKKDDTL